MRRILLPLLTMAMLLAAATPAAAATETFRYSIQGAGAWASGVRYTDTTFDAAWVELGDEAARASDGESFLSYVLFEHLREVCDAGGCITEYTSGWAENVPFSIDRKKLMSASVDVTIDAVRCTDDGQSETCDPVQVPVSISWSGFGKMIRSHGTGSGGIAGEYQYTLNGAATERWANVSGSIGGFDLSTAFDPIGALYKTRYAERTVSHI
jgi:hypothetical protein